MTKGYTALHVGHGALDVRMVLLYLVVPAAIVAGGVLMRRVRGRRRGATVTDASG